MNIYGRYLYYFCKWRAKRHFLMVFKFKALVLFGKTFLEVTPDSKPELTKLALAKLSKYAELEEDTIMSNEITLGSKVAIKECHSMPQIVGKTGVVKALLFVDESNPYPMYVILDEPIMLSQETPPQMGGIVIQIPWRGPHLCRPDELELVGGEKKTDIPDAFNKAFDVKKPKEGEDGNLDSPGQAK